MKLDDKIRNRKIAYLLKRESSTAFELALLYYILGKRRIAEDKIKDSCLRSLYWMKKAGLIIPECLKQLSPFAQLEEIEKMLVFNKAGVGARLSTEVLT